MSETPSPNAKPEAKADAHPKPAGPPLMLLIGAAVGALAIGGAAGALVLGPQVVAMQRAAASKPAAKPAEAEGKSKHGEKDTEHPVFRIDNVIVNPSGSQGSRFLLTSVAIEMPDTKTLDRMRAREAEVRDVVITTLERHTLDQLSQPGARDSLKHDLAAVLQPMVGEGELHIFLPQFVIQ